MRLKNKKTPQWSKLDNAAKIFPPNSNKSDTKVFRFTCQLKEPVDKDALQQAVDETLEMFPMYRSIIKSGLFWYYLETSTQCPVVKEEDSPPCGPLFDKNKKNLLFEVTYYRSRINVEIYHALTDGTGALQFLRTLVMQYLVIRHRDTFKDKIPAIDYDASISQKMDDSFQKYYSGGGIRMKRKRVGAYKIRGPHVSESRIRVIEGHMPVSEVMGKVKEYNTTLTVFVVAALMKAISDEMALRHKNKPVVISVPVNLRKYFHSESARNFFGVISVGYDFKNNPGTIEDIIKRVGECFKEELTADKLSRRMNSLAALEHNMFMRAIPLALKNIILHIANNITDAEETCTVSNLGKIDMPSELGEYIELFDVFISTNKMQLCICSYGDVLNLAFTSAFISADIQRNFFRTLSGMGIDVKIVSNHDEED